MNKLVTTALLAGTSLFAENAAAQAPVTAPALLNNFWGVMQEVCNPGGYSRKEWSTDEGVKYAGFSRDAPTGNPRMMASFYDTGARKFDARSMLDSLQVTQADPATAGRQQAFYILRQKDGSYLGRLASIQDAAVMDIASDEIRQLNDQHSGDPNRYIPFIKKTFRPLPE